MKNLNIAYYWQQEAMQIGENTVQRKSRFYHGFLIALILIGVGRIASTYTLFGQSWDEPEHIASGLEWWENGTYTYENLHPPLARIANSAGLYLLGVRSTGKRDIAEGDRSIIAGGNRVRSIITAGNRLLHTEGQYERNLTLARMGTLPFYIASVILVYVLGLRLLDRPTATLAALLYSTLPPILAWSSFAYTDMALVAGFLFFIVCWLRWLEAQTFKNSIWLGMSLTAAIASKYSAIPYIIACTSASIVMLAIQRKISPLRLLLFPVRAWKPLLITAFVFFLTMWAVFRFSLEPISPLKGSHERIDRIVASSGLLHNLASWVVETPLPLTELSYGLNQLLEANTPGFYLTIFFGKVYSHGLWYYFPVMLAVASPIAYLLLILAVPVVQYFVGLFEQKQSYARLIPVFALVILSINMQSNINISGVRHILAIFPFMSLIAATVCIRLWYLRGGLPWLRVLTCALVIGHVSSSFAAHPDYVEYFNALAGDEPENLFGMDSGENNKRLALEINRLNIKNISVALAGEDDLSFLNLPSYQELQPFVYTSGWIAISVWQLQVGKEKPPYNGFAWLNQYQPVAKVGKTIRIYNIPPNR